MRLSLAITALLVGASQGAPHAPISNFDINRLAQLQHKLWFGSAADIPGTAETTDTAYLKLLKSTFGEVTPANAMKFMYTEPEKNVFNFTEGDQFLEVAESFGAKLSDFVTSQNWTAEALTAVMKNHIFKTLQHFGRRCYSWDVVNEALNSDGSFSSSVWYDTIGDDYFYLEYHYAQQALAEIGANDVKLYYNDYGIENPGTKATAALQLVKNLRARGIRIDGIGLESHFIVGETPSLADQLATKQSYINANLDVAVTELDVRFSAAPFYTAAAQQQQAQDYYTSVASCVKAGPRCIGMTVWDFDDAYSWVPGAFAGQGGACLFNNTLDAKPAYYAVAQALEGASLTV
ncbi:Endo-1-4-beta-xylanase D [Penicillium malachiteum]|nr:Endo-1-4-beta-xylanase D [Penicillium malachiteum]